MDPLTIGMLGLGAGGMVAGAMGQNSANQLNAESVDKTNEANRLNQRQNQEWMEMMSNTAYQRSMADMKKAGLNPMLAFMKGGASTPSSSPAVAQSKHYENIHAGTAQSALNLSSQYRDAIRADNETKLNQEAVQTEHTKQGLNVSSATAQEAVARKANAEAEIAENALPKTKKEREFYEKFGMAPFITGGVFGNAPSIMGKMLREKVDSYLRNADEVGKTSAKAVNEGVSKVRQHWDKYQKQFGDAFVSRKFKRK